MSKVINIKFTFTDDEWVRLRRHYKESEVRQSLYDGALGDLGDILENRENMEDAPRIECMVCDNLIDNEGDPFCSSCDPHYMIDDNGIVRHYKGEL